MSISLAPFARLSAALRRLIPPGAPWAVRQLSAEAYAHRAGVRREIVFHARAGRRVHADAYLKLCALAGIDPIAGAAAPDATIPGDIVWTMVGASVRAKRMALGDPSLRAFAAELPFSYSTLSRVESGHAVATEHFLALCDLVGLHPHHFTGAPASRETAVQHVENAGADA